MIVTCVHVWVKPEFIDEFIKATTENHEQSIKEKGNLRFDFLQDANDPNKFLIYEAYASEEDVMLHKETEHYFKWRETAEKMMAKPREGIKHKVIAPQDSKLW